MSRIEQDLESFSNEFPIPSGALIMNSAAISPLPRSTEKVIQEAIKKLQVDVIFDHLPVFAIVDQCREQISKLLNCPSSRIGLTGNCASALSLCAFGMKLKRGDRILLWDQEYPSLGFPWLQAAKRAGAEVEILRSKPNLDLDDSLLLEKIKTGVKVVALSWVQFQSGVVSPLEEIAAACRRVGARFIVDVFQGVGVIPFDFKKSGVHAACGGSHKWLSGPTGSGYLALDDEFFEELEPVMIGAGSFNAIGATLDPTLPLQESARRFEPGAPNILNLAGWSKSISLYLSAGIEKVHEQAMDISRRLISGLPERGFELLGTQDFVRRQSPITTFKYKDGRSPEKLYEHLNKNRVAFSPRGGGVRLSPHGFNKRGEVERFFEIVDGM